jgi:hypothetical protein
MTGIRGGATFIGVLFAVPDTVLKRESRTFVVLLLADGGDPVGGGLELPPGTVWREPGVAGAEFDSVGWARVFMNGGGG